ncbi:hypothetical protein NA56DRAFT_710827 [Hyaloscypha hepaticicola]|uniref:Uncharacterized protein n=1 Tax=Hyaloscypha hepaticicola TaxID=2082293 RepID=A0A2J6PKE9_9HELO|nr:hypothetical protein NA56DRAFT_710827 [Hyaloscypha hepaticicola]
MNNTAGSIINSAHSCRYCREVVIRRPSQQQCDDADIGEILPIAEIDGSTAMLAASDGCNFFEWAVKEFNKNEGRSKTDDGDVYDDWSLRIGILEGHLRDHESSFPFVSFEWYHKNRKFYILDGLLLSQKKMILRHDTLRRGPQVGPSRLRKYSALPWVG